MMHLKSKVRGGDRKFAVLLEPKISPSATSSDEEMYSIVAKNGKAEIAALESEFSTIATTGTPVSIPEPKRKISGWTPERHAKFRRTMRLKREGKL